jgi:uncharacterized protein (TIGR00251 family)
MSFTRPGKNGVLLDIKVTPKASRQEISGEKGGRLAVKIAAPPVDGKANAELFALLAKKLGVKKNALSFVSGETSRLKTINVEMTGVGAAVLVEKALLGHACP